MVKVKKPKIPIKEYREPLKTFLDVTNKKDDPKDKYYIIPSTKKSPFDPDRLLGEVDIDEYENHSGKYYTDDMIPIIRSRSKKKRAKPKPRRKLAKKMCRCV